MKTGLLQTEGDYKLKAPRTTKNVKQQLTERHSRDKYLVTIMVKRAFDLIYDLRVKVHFEAIELKYYSLIRSAIETQLRFEPDIETTNRKPLKRSTQLEADWEIRFGPGNRFRVFYEVDPLMYEVHILAIGEKRGAQLFVGGEEFDL
ncbi:MAG: addiction module toxin RelE [Candidatus Sumerlaeota bacterium]|nr:addiction module toxin RelE [Candidatus Sumerlaeota bacterium]